MYDRRILYKCGVKPCVTYMRVVYVSPGMRVRSSLNVYHRSSSYMCAVSTRLTCGPHESGMCVTRCAGSICICRGLRLVLASPHTHFLARAVLKQWVMLAKLSKSLIALKLQWSGIVLRFCQFNAVLLSRVTCLAGSARACHMGFTATGTSYSVHHEIQFTYEACGFPQR